MNYQQQRLLAKAELLQISNRTDQAGTYYEPVIAATRTCNYLQSAALANELTAKFYLSFGNERIAAGYMQEAYYSYARLGAEAKTDDLAQRYPDLLCPILHQAAPVLSPLETLAAFATSHQPVDESRSDSSTSTSLNSASNFATILQAAQNLSSTIQLDELLYQLTQIILQNSGGDRCALILPNQEGEWLVRAIATLDNTQLYTVPLNDHPHLPVRLIQYVKNTQDVVVIDNLKTDLPVIDEYLIQQQPKSLLCLPILHQGRLIGILYLKNRSTSGAFTHDRILILNFLCTQAAISLENARLYAAEQEKTEKLQASEQRLKIIFEQASDAILLLGESGFIDCNQAALDLFQYQNKSQLLNLHPPQVSPEFQPDGMSSVAKGQQIIPQVFAQGSLKLEWVHQRSNGENFDAEVTLTAIPYQSGKIIHGLIRDISDRKRLEAEQQRLIDILEATPDYVGIVNGKGEPIWGNQPLRSLRPDFNQIKHISEFQPAWANEIMFNQAIPTAIAQGSWSGELAILDAEGQELLVSRVLLAHKSATGEVDYFSTIMRDISAYKRAEETLQQQLATIEASIDGIAILQGDTYTYLNQSHLTLLGYNSIDELLGKTWRELYYPDEIERFESTVFPFLERERYWTGEAKAKRKDGTILDQEISLTLIEGGNLVCVCRDISDRKCLEAEQQRILDVLEATPDYVGVAGINGELIWNNAPLRKLRPDIAELKHISEFHPAWANEIMFNQAIPTAIIQGSWSGETSILDDKGREIPISQVIVAHKSVSGEGNYFSTIMRDISDQKAYEQNLEQKNAELMRATRLKDEFLANMSHELRTPLNAILGMTQGLQEAIFGPINDRQLSALNTVEKSSAHLLCLINDILDVAKIESGQFTLDYSSIGVKQLCASSMAFVKQHALQKDIQLHTQIPEQLPALFADEVRIRQVLLNLLTNAVKFTPTGGRVTLSVLVCTATEDVSEPTYLRFAISDNGIGIAPENISKLFQPFIQIDSALNRQQTGTGLGLALVRQIVELHGGQVGLTSELGVGSCFTVDLPHTPSISLLTSEPLPNAPEFERTASAVSEPTSNQGALILLAEDNAANVATISSYLQVKGYRLVYAINGREAIDLFLIHQPDLILMDIQMPGFDGLEAIKQIRQQESLCETPIIALTALAMQGDRERCLAAGANEYLSKPVKLKQLDAAIKALLADRRPQ